MEDERWNLPHNKNAKSLKDGSRKKKFKRWKLKGWKLKFKKKTFECWKMKDEFWDITQIHKVYKV